MGSDHSKRASGGIVYSTDPEFSPAAAGEKTPTVAPALQRLQVRLDTKHRKGKTVTLVEGFAGAQADLQQLGKKLKTACGTGGNVKDGQILVQGSHLEQVRGLLKAWGYGLG